MDVREFYERMLDTGRRLARAGGLTGEAVDRYAQRFARGWEPEPEPEPAADPWEAAVARMESIMRLSGQDYGGPAGVRAAAERAMSAEYGGSVAAAREAWRADGVSRGGGSATGGAAGGASSLDIARAHAEAALTQVAGLRVDEAIRLVDERVRAGASAADLSQWALSLSRRGVSRPAGSYRGWSR